MKEVTYVISKEIAPTLRKAYKIMEQLFPEHTYAHYPEDQTFDVFDTMLFHDINWYFDLLRREEYEK